MTQVRTCRIQRGHKLTPWNGTGPLGTVDGAPAPHSQAGPAPERHLALSHHLVRYGVTLSAPEPSELSGVCLSPRQGFASRGRLVISRACAAA